MVCMTIICAVWITVFSVVHMRSCFRASRYAAYVVAVFANLRAAVNSAKTMLMYFCLCAA